FHSVRDLHTNYLLPAPFAGVLAYLPFRVEACIENGKRAYIVGGVATGFSHPTFKPGVTIIYWNGTPIARAVEHAADRHAGSNLEARHSRGLAGLTARPLIIAPPPDEEWVIVRYRTQSGASHELRFDWLVTGLPSAPGGAGGTGAAHLEGVDLETQLIQDARRLLFAPQTEGRSARMAEAADPLSLVSGLESTMPSVFAARQVATSHGTFGHIRIWTFSADPDAFVAEFIRLAGLLPQTGLIVDVRDNGGGVILAGEQLLQVLTPRAIEPERVQFINTPLTLRLCELHPGPGGIDLSPWLPSIRRSVETGAVYSASHPITPPERCNDIGQRYQGPVVLITDALCYSTTDIFAAGFQDHGIGPILGVDGNTGAGGANVWTHGLLEDLFSQGFPPKPVPDSPFKALPKGANMRVAIRRTLRVGPNAGAEVEDLGVTPDHRHQMTRADVLNGNVDLMERAASLLAGQPVFTLAFTATPQPGGALQVSVSYDHLDRLDFYVDGRPQASKTVDPQAHAANVALPVTGAAVRIDGYRNGGLVASRRELI
ncbi:S41 family peptidase, partial [Phenylobacterium sp.]|uniref:S41 family peptidase n=1 Tax=Phenylobacterium sp. TaxID=1871053 RepID=UPI002ED877F1